MELLRLAGNQGPLHIVSVQLCDGGAHQCHEQRGLLCIALPSSFIAHAGKLADVACWEQVTKVGRGQKLGDNAEAVPFSDMTVEDLLRIVRSLPPEESAVAAVSRGLFYLDSRALAALLKELHKVGLSNRCAHTACADASMAAVTCATHH